MPKSTRYSPEVRARAVRLVEDHIHEYPSPWAAITSIAEKIGCSGETLRKWVQQQERDTGRRSGLRTEEQAALRALERENRELKRANEILGGGRMCPREPNGTVPALYTSLWRSTGDTERRRCTGRGTHEHTESRRWAGGARPRREHLHHSVLETPRSRSAA